jgi:hypothetical protein
MQIHLVPFSREQVGYQSPLMIHHRNRSFYFHFLQAVVAGPILGIDFLRKFRITNAPETSQIMFACSAAAQPVTKPSSPIFFKHATGPPAPPGASPPLSKLLAKGSQVASQQSYSQGNQSIVDPPLSALPARLCQFQPSPFRILCLQM